MRIKKIKDLTLTEIIKGVVGLIFAFILAYFVYSFIPKNENQNIINVESPTIAVSNDSSTQVIYQNKQNNSNTGNVINEYIAGDKNIIQKDINSQNKGSKKQASTHIDKIENNGNLSIGQTGGIINQTTVIDSKPKIPEPRHLTNGDANLILKSIFLTYSVEVNYPMIDSQDIYPGSNKESSDFANEILNYLYRTGYNKLSRGQYGIISPDPDKRFDIRVNDVEKSATIIVYRQKLKQW